MRKIVRIILRILYVLAILLLLLLFFFDISNYIYLKLEILGHRFAPLSAYWELFPSYLAEGHLPANAGIPGLLIAAAIVALPFYGRIWRIIKMR